MAHKNTIACPVAQVAVPLWLTKVLLPVMLDRLQYHYGSQRVTADERIYYRDGPPRLVQVMPHTTPPLQALLAEEHQALLTAERDCLQVCLTLHCH